MAQRKKPAKKSTIKSPARLSKTAVTVPIDESEEPLEFPESPASSNYDSKRVGHLSEAHWSAKNLVELDDKVELDELEPEPEEESDNSVDIVEMDGIASVAKFEWKFENQAQGAPRKKIADEAGYEALLDAVKVKKVSKNIVVWLYTLKPAKDEQDWDTGDPDYVERPFNFDEEAGATCTTKALIDDMSTKQRMAVTELESLYPVSRYTLFPNKRVWHDKRMDTYFELTELHMKVWANSIAAGRADKSAPPTMSHFTNKLKVPRPPPEAPISTFGDFYHHRQRDQAFKDQESAPPLPLHGQSIPPHPHGQPIPPFQGAHVPGPPHQFYHPAQYMQPPIFGGYPYPPPYYPVMQGHGQPQATGQPMGEISSASSSPSITTSHDVSLSEFCTKYCISDSDQVKLAALEYQPGNRVVETLDDREW
ncbi:uncharacterized protein EDB91DRAFT_1242136 [Suillus paluster]|uniref:uncharacterized protein n=1 Tax=Suillus paluster TaxID=48578 RepID=UPI001B86E767|nr:uncharacterized protein EDB91DRAFT_1242136 [Suillus paluster]KAG1754915.1 hypothetical protein EDB91DRAFT_1242136 [Suillus paluster]